MGFNEFLGQVKQGHGADAVRKEHKRLGNRYGGATRLGASVIKMAATLGNDSTSEKTI